MNKIIQNKKAVGPIGAIFLFIAFVVIWFVALGKTIADIGHNAVVSNGLTGIEAFALDNLNLTIMLVLFLAMMAWMYFGGE